ncbi:MULTISPECIES: hypothetical protein [Pseudomonas]|uniref:hypothetical protein n=1 Tax=Pseudomonas TaxID=286 RepID=UPI000FC41077|nr:MULTISPECIES: hypothetical protein [Pseudomonas]RUE17033.1 hypothetical protein IPC1222_25315 [Pseudomonas aeruginosa]CAH0136122.1 hypothetical protein SRABI111_00342 [Pseudomonas carnis]CAH0139065.1 hypothetical protein SRABI110_00486 [Pseudomonas carnis]CAH0157977.1 hypothetical protein SRABI64_00706 [Pseudomonas carnis]CAH0202200.1 hypothetical protein SRABI08_01920 [Pseudomonas carnis]
MNDTTKPKSYIELTEDMLEQDIKALVTSIDTFLNNHSDGTAFIPKPMLSVFESHSSLKGKGRYKASTSKYPYVVPRSKAPQKLHEYVTSYKVHPLIHSLFIAIAYHAYTYQTHNLISELPKVVNSSIYSLAVWGLNDLNTKKSNIKALSAINTVFSLVTSGTPIDYLKHVMNSFQVDLNNTQINKVSTIKTETGLTVTFILSDVYCVAMIGKKGFVAAITDETELCVDNYEFLLTPDGVLEQEKKHLGVSLHSFDFKQETKTALASLPKLKTKK